MACLFVVLSLCSSTGAFLNGRPLRPATQRGGHYSVAVEEPNLFAAAATRLCAAKKKAPRNKNASGSTAGFGGAATEACACGSGLAYNKCCGKLHKDPSSYAAAPASRVVRARYSAYAKRVVDFIIASTHPLNPSFEQDMEHWKKTMEQDCFDNFELTKCDILEESYQGQGSDGTATVRFIAHMIQRDTQQRSAFMETSTFERDASTGAWLYRNGDVVHVDFAEEAS